MNRRWNHSKVLVLFVLASMALMAVTVAGAQANGEWEINGQTLASLSINEESVKGQGEGGEFLISGLGLELACVQVNINSAVILQNGANEPDAEATVLFTGCEVLGSEVCDVYETAMKKELLESLGNIIASGTALLSSAGEGSSLIILGHPLKTLYFSSQEKGCNLPLEDTISGSIVMTLPNASTSSAGQLMELSSWLLHYGSEPIDLHAGDGTVYLNGANDLEPWSVQ